MVANYGDDAGCMSIWGNDCPGGEYPTHACKLQNGHYGSDCICIDCGQDPNGKVIAEPVSLSLAEEEPTP